MKERTIDLEDGETFLDLDNAFLAIVNDESIIRVSLFTNDGRKLFDSWATKSELLPPKATGTKP